MDAQEVMPILTTSLPARDLNITEYMAWVERHGHRNRALQLIDITRLGRGRGFDSNEYFLYAFFAAQNPVKTATPFLSTKMAQKLCLELSPFGLNGLHGLLTDKAMTGCLLRDLGFTTSTDLAIYHPNKPVRHTLNLRTRDEIVHFLTRSDHYPCFGKPNNLSRSIGGISIVDGSEGTVKLADGRVVPVTDLADEIIAAFPDGYLFQKTLIPHPDLAQVTGKTASTLRVVTVRHQTEIHCLYTVQKIPPEGAMTDGFAANGPNAMCWVDPADGTIKRAQSMGRMNLNALEVSPHSGKELIGLKLPSVPDAVQTCKEVHSCITQHGILGFDVVLTTDGPVINEINSLPIHGIFQRSANQGLMSPERSAIIKEAHHETKRQVAAYR